MTLSFDLPSSSASPLAHTDPRWKLAGVALLLASTAALRGIGPVLAALAVAALLAALAGLPRRWLAARLGATLLIVAPFLIVLPFVQGVNGLVLGAVVAAKVVALTALALALLATTPLPALGLAAQRLRLPRRLVQVGLLTYRYALELGDELRRLRVALRARGFRARATRHGYRTVGQVAGTLLVRGAERAEGVARAMRCRGFDGRFRALDDFHTARRDVVFFLGCAATAALLVAWDWGSRG
jgi:cobalt/nickel transport system permease protein